MLCFPEKYGIITNESRLISMENFMLWTDILIIASKALLLVLPVASVLLFLVKVAIYFMERRDSAPELQAKMKRGILISGLLALGVTALARVGWWVLHPLF